MTRALTIVSFLLAANVAAADPTPVAKPAETAAAPAKATCKRTVVGRGLDRHVVCEIEAPIIVKQAAPRPNVIIVHPSGRAVVGRPRSDDRLAGLSHHLD